MADILTYVYVNYKGQDIPVGRLWSYFNNGKESASFKYDESWLKNPENFELEPYLPLTEGTFHTDTQKSIFASFSDCSPDSWGRLLIKKNEEKRAENEKERGGSLIRLTICWPFMISPDTERYVLSKRRTVCFYHQKTKKPFRRW